MQAMIFKLDKNAGKGRWQDVDIIGYLAKLSLEFKELEEAIQQGNTVNILLEAADVANFALIIASKELDGDKND